MAGAGAIEWTWEEKRYFEDAMEEVPDETPAKLEIIAARMRKPVEEIKNHYEKMVDIALLESGGDVIVPKPEHSTPSPATITPKKWTWEEKRDSEVAIAQVPNTPAKLEITAAEKRKPVEDEKLVQDVENIESGGDVVPEYSTRSPTPIVAKRKTRWSVEEHERFLQGLKALGRGKWGDIARDFVKTRDAIQVTGYANRYFKANKAEKQD